MQHSPSKREALIQDRLIINGGFYTRLYGTDNILTYFPLLISHFTVPCRAVSHNLFLPNITIPKQTLKQETPCQ